VGRLADADSYSGCLGVVVSALFYDFVWKEALTNQMITPTTTKMTQ
jgi:hypothetical protein